MAEWWALIERGGPAAVLVIALWGFKAGWWYTPHYVHRLERQLEAEQEERRQWTELALRASGIAKELTTFVRERRP